MIEFIRIIVTPEMREDLKECEDMASHGEERECSECSLDGGDCIGCLAGYEWCEGE